MNKLARITRWLLFFACLFAGLGLLLLFLPPYSQGRLFADRLSPDGTLEMFSPDIYQSAHLPGMAAGFFLLLLSGLILVLKERSLHLITKLFQLPALLFQDGRVFTADLRAFRLTRWELVLLLGMVALAVLARAPFLERQLEHDEAYTIVVFASAPLREGLTDYHHPNNHIFHTLLAHFSYLLFGYHPWGVRLPAFLVSLMVVPALFYLARFLYGRLVGFQSAALAAVWPILIYYGTNARGYTLVMLLTLLILLLAIYVRERNNLLGWALLALFATLGLYTIPLFLFPLAMVMTWLTLTMLIKDYKSSYLSRWQFFRSILITGIVIVFLTILLYIPVILRNGLNSSLVGDVTRRPGWGTYLEILRSRMDDNWAHWTQEITPPHPNIDDHRVCSLLHDGYTPS